MTNKVQWRLTGTYLLLIVILLSISGMIAYFSFKAYYVNNLEETMDREASLVVQLISINDTGTNETNSYQNICDTAAEEMTRITIIDRNGKVLGDSVFDVNEMDNHSNRPEVFSALKGEQGVSQRYSKTAEMEMVYVAIPFVTANLSGAVRIAKPLVYLNTIYQKILSIVFLAILIAGFIALLLSMVMAERFSRPIHEMTEAVKDISRGNFKRKISSAWEDEFGLLANAFNDMGDYIDRGISEISEINNRFRILLENTINGILMVNSIGNITYANPVAIMLLGFPENVTGRRYAELISDYEMLETIQHVNKTKKSIRKDITMHVLGSKVVELNAVPIEGSEVAYQGVLIILHDISETRRLEKVRKDFVANVSHELKTPVATISGFAETLLAEGAQGSENTMEFTQIIYDEAQRLGCLINQLLELSKLESDNKKLDKTEIDLKQLIQQAVEIVQRRNTRNDLVITYQTDSTDPVYIFSHPDAITQVLNNFLDNAINYSPDGGIITVELKESEGLIQIDVTDQGVGIPQKDLPRIFERFYRVDKDRSRKTGGTGLGLSIVKHIVENLGGSVTVQSLPGEGSTFSAIFPNK
ncbi:MAG: ATP-binding protein [Bacillota bacterium]|nr:ATP-binding protein [Bacillota bacterium]